MCAMLFFFFFNLRSSRLQFLTQYIKLNAILVFCQLAYFLPLIALILEYWCKIWEWRGIIQICHFFTLPPWLQFMKQWEFREKNQERTFLILFQRTQWKAEEKKKTCNLSNSAAIYKIRRLMLADVRRVKRGR